MSDFILRSQNVFSPVLGRYTSLEISHAAGCYLYDMKGSAYLDFASGIAVTSTGHCHPQVVKAIQDQAEKMIHPCIGIGHYDISLRLAEKLVRLLPHSDYAVFFAQSGTEAVEASLKLARYIKRKPVFVAFKGGFHGRTLGSLAVTSSKEKYREGYAPFLPDVRFFDYPYLYRCPFNGISELESANLAIEALDRSEILDDQVSAVIIEPILGEGGYTAAPKAFLQALTKRCKEKGILLILDEIQSGMGRTGSWFYFQQLGLDPDIITVAKGIASGMPLSACIAKKEYMQAWSTGAHGGTYGANPVCCAASLATISVIEDCIQDIPEKSSLIQNFLVHKLRENPIVGDIRIYGLMIGIELVKDKTSKAPLSEAIQSIIEKCLEKNLLIISCGIHSNVLRIAPPLTISGSLLIEGMEILTEVLNDYASR